MSKKLLRGLIVLVVCLCCVLLWYNWMSNKNGTSNEQLLARVKGLEEQIGQLEARIDRLGEIFSIEQSRHNETLALRRSMLDGLNRMAESLTNNLKIEGNSSDLNQVAPQNKVISSGNVELESSDSVVELVQQSQQPTNDQGQPKKHLVVPDSAPAHSDADLQADVTLAQSSTDSVQKEVAQPSEDQRLTPEASTTDLSDKTVEQNEASQSQDTEQTTQDSEQQRSTQP